jgi:hypothetical protein
MSSMRKALQITILRPSAHIVPSNNVHPARPRHLHLIKVFKLERSSQSQCLEGLHHVYQHAA